MKPPQHCYRVPVRWGELRLAPVITARNRYEAFARVTEMAEDLIWRREPWLLESGHTKPLPDEIHPIVIGEPLLLHRKGLHR